MGQHYNNLKKKGGNSSQQSSGNIKLPQPEIANPPKQWNNQQQSAIDNSRRQQEYRQQNEMTKARILQNLDETQNINNKLRQSRQQPDSSNSLKKQNIPQNSNSETHKNIGKKTFDEINQYANDPNVVDLRDSKTLTPKLLRGGSYDNPLAKNVKKTFVDPNDLKRDDPKLQKLEKQPPPLPPSNPSILEDQIAQKKSEIEHLKFEMADVQKKRIEKIRVIEEMGVNPAEMYGVTPYQRDYNNYIAQEEELMAGMMKYQGGSPPDSMKTLIGVRKAELRDIKREHLQLGDRLEKAENDLKKLENQNRQESADKK